MRGRGAAEWLRAATAGLLLLSVPAWGQAAPSPPPTSSESNPSTALPPGVVAAADNPNLSVATVRLKDGVRVSTVVGAAVLDGAGQRLGSINDLVVTGGDRVTVAVIAVGGFYGLGSKLVAVPFAVLKRDGGSYTLPGATKESLNAMPNFEY